MKTHQRLLIMILGIGLQACQRSHLETRVWSDTSNAPGTAKPSPGLPQHVLGWANDPDFHSLQNSIRIGPELIIRKVQVFNGVEIEGSWLREIRDTRKTSATEPEGQRVFVAQQKLEAPFNVRRRAAILTYRLRESRVRERISRFLESNSLSLDDGPRVMISPTDIHKANAELHVIASRHMTGEFFKLKFNLSGRILEQQSVGAGFNADALLAQVFPLGPRKSGLAWVPLFLRSGGGLGNSDFTVSSQSGAKVDLSTDRISFALDDTRFDQVQVYYFLENFLNGLRTRHGFSLPTPLKVETHIGYPDSSNAAFYFQQVLRFGTGDGTVYLELMRDPTIVVHEAAHAVIDALARLPFQGEGGSISEGMADFLAASSLNNPRMGEDSYIGGPYRRNIDNRRTWLDRQGKLYADSEIVSGFFWDLRQHIGAQKSEEFALRVLARLLPSAGLDDMRLQILELIPTLPAAEQAHITSIMLDRKWK